MTSSRQVSNSYTASVKVSSIPPLYSTIQEVPGSTPVIKVGRDHVKPRGVHYSTLQSLSWSYIFAICSENPYYLFGDYIGSGGILTFLGVNFN